MNAADFRRLIKAAAAHAVKPEADGTPRDPDLQLCVFIGALEGGLSVHDPALASCLRTVGRPAPAPKLPCLQ